MEVLDRRYPEALERLRDTSLDEDFHWQFWFVPRTQWLGEVFRLMGQQDSSRVYYEAARPVLEAKVRESPMDPRYHSSLGIVLAALGHREEAVRTARRGVDTVGQLVRLDGVAPDAPEGELRLTAGMGCYSCLRRPGCSVAAAGLDAVPG